MKSRNKIIAEQDDWSLQKLESWAISASYHHQGWCTSTDKEEFDEYTESGDLWVLFKPRDRATRPAYQIHINENETYAEVMGSGNRNSSLTALSEIAPKRIKAWLDGKAQVIAEAAKVEAARREKMLAEPRNNGENVFIGRGGGAGGGQIVISDGGQFHTYHDKAWHYDINQPMPVLYNNRFVEPSRHYQIHMEASRDVDRLSEALKNSNENDRFILHMECQGLLEHRFAPMDKTTSYGSLDEIDFARVLIMADVGNTIVFPVPESSRSISFVIQSKQVDFPRDGNPQYSARLESFNHHQ